METSSVAAATADPNDNSPCSWSTVVFDLRRSVSNLVLYVLESMPIPWVFPPGGTMTAAPPSTTGNPMEGFDAWLDQAASAVLEPREPVVAVASSPPAAAVKEEPLPPQQTPAPPKPKRSSAPKRKTPAATATPMAGAALDALVRDTLA